MPHIPIFLRSNPFLLGGTARQHALANSEGEVEETISRSSSSSYVRTYV